MRFMPADENFLKENTNTFELNLTINNEVKFKAKVGCWLQLPREI